MPPGEPDERRQVVLASVTLGAAVGVFAIAFGVGAVPAGGTVAPTCAMSLLVFTGTSQFSAVSLVEGGGSLIVVGAAVTAIVRQVA